MDRDGSVVEPAFGAELRRRRLAAGLSLSQFCTRIYYSKGYLSKVETGKAAGNREFAQACDDALAADGALVALAPPETSRQAGDDAVTAIVGLPPATPTFLGRTRELDQLADFLSAGHGRTTCVLSGMAGAGKTALALAGAWQAVADFPDGCLFLDLGGHTPDAPYATAHDALSPLLRFLGVPDDQVPSDYPVRANLYRSRLRGKRILIVLDNARNAAQIAPLVPSEPGCRILVTSRGRLNALDDAVALPVDVLPHQESVELFITVGGARAANAPAEVIARIAGRCGGLPLAIRIAAARFRCGSGWTAAEFDERLADESARLDVLDDGERSVAAAFALSTGELPPDQLRLFGLLALYPGRDIEVRAVAALAGVPLAAARVLLDRLGDANLVGLGPDDRVLVHDLVRQFARTRVLPAVAAEDQDAAVRRVLDHSLLLARSSDELIAPHRYRLAVVIGELPDGSVGFSAAEPATRWREREWPALVGLCRLAAERGFLAQCWQLAFLMRDFFFLTKRWEPWIDTHALAARCARQAGDVLALAMTLNNLGVAYVDRGDLAVAVGYYAEALELFGEAGDEHGITTARSHLAWAALYLGEPETALRDLGEAVEAYRRLGNPRNVAITLRGMSLAETELARYADAIAHAERSRVESVRMNLRLDAVMSVNCAAWAHFRSGDLDAAHRSYAEAVALGEECGSAYEVARAITGLGNVHAARGDEAGAYALWAQADDKHNRLDPVIVGESRARAAAGN
ncbi:XRE family transcriptional regulator [Actinokineospora sp. UTMC 2448]|uniref:XRE family transcriptional regulator n=1 Tax=Actinokineospora sp. UTMC 2448 TaxID=2268449 RepID=UPI0021644B5A|nr:XRE family transcriptional regulator [Actinokineospora sp. UTMC 2448]UVS79461.1 Regulatory protein AfsR [Actinokineospora sp. UTMC 2448]